MKGLGESEFDPVAALSGSALPAHVYIHVPFCRTRCSYCDFFSITDISDPRVEPVIRGLEGEITRWATASLPGVVETVYIGGGTPTFLASRLVGIVRHVLDMLPHKPTVEVTVEANPDSLTRLLVEGLAAAGVTRISLGVQSFQESELALLGRVHSVDEANEAARAVLDAGLSLSVDLMCGIPGQSDRSWLLTLEQAVMTGASHISVYPLTLEPGTPLDAACGSGLVEQPDSDLTATQMLLAEEHLTASGLRRYEVANYSVPGNECLHNLAYWTGRSYMGIGPSAHGMLDAATASSLGMLDVEAMPEVTRVRYAQPSDIDTWLTDGRLEREYLDAAQTAREDVMLGLRLTRGVPVAAVRTAGVMDVLEDLEHSGLVERTTNAGAICFRTTRKGWLLGNEVFSRVWHGT